MKIYDARRNFFVFALFSEILLMFERNENFYSWRNGTDLEVEIEWN